MTSWTDALTHFVNEKDKGRNLGYSDRSTTLPTHLVLTGGKLCIRSGDDRNTFYRLLVDAMSVDGGLMPCLTENHTVVFPLYFDFDCKFPVATLTDEALAVITRIVAGHVARFYDNATGVRTVVLTRTGTPDKLENGTYKLGIHMHFPRILVKEKQARQIRLGVVTGLCAYAKWTDLVGEDPRWDGIVDESVYSGGLRMLGAPKASKCTACKPEHPTCAVCKRNNNCRVIDPRVYVLHMACVDGQRDDVYETLLRSNGMTLLNACTVRSDEVNETPGYAVYEGCPILAEGGRKRKMIDDASRPGERRYTTEITSERAKRILKRYLVRFSDKYAECRVQVVKRRDNRIRGYLVGDNATYCLNKKDNHKSNRVFLEVRPKRTQQHHEVVMKCFCPCKTARFGAKTCHDYVSPPVTLDKGDTQELFSSMPCEVCDDEDDAPRPPKSAMQIQLEKEDAEYLAMVARRARA